MGAAAPAWPGLAGACSEEVRHPAEPRSAASAGLAVRDYSGQPVKAANYGSDNEMIRRSDDGDAYCSACQQGAFSDHLIV